MINRTKIKVRYVETDQMGIVHHSNYYHWFEVGRTELLNQIGMSYSDIEKQGILFPLIETHCYYKNGAKYEDELTIETKLSELKGAKAYFTYKVIRNKDNKILAEGNTVHTFTNTEFKPINLKKQNLTLYNKLMSCVE